MCDYKSKIKDNMNLYKLNHKKFNDLKLFIQSNKQITEKEILSKINDIRNSKDFIEPLDSKELKLLIVLLIKQFKEFI